MPNNIYTHSRFNPDNFGNGGCKRTAQIHELLNKNEIHFNLADFEPYTSKSKSVANYLSGLNYNKQISTNFRNDHNIGRYINAFHKFVEQQNPSLFIWESVSEFYLLLAHVLYSKKIPFIALPQNIESLVTGTRSFTSGANAPEWFEEELKYLKYSNKVFAISREEQWLLSIYGVEADFLPYYPTDNVVDYLLNIRKEKEKKDTNKSPKKILLLGTFYNPPTLNGYIRLITHLSGFKDIIVNVTGYGAELLEKFAKPNIKIWGSVTTQVLGEIIVDNDMVILDQEPTSGALTRIPELLIAGLPILANATASRSNYDLEGLYVYRNYEELADLIYNSPLTTPVVPLRPLLAEKRFVDAIRGLV
jgi:hypothetical protein